MIRIDAVNALICPGFDRGVRGGPLILGPGADEEMFPVALVPYDGCFHPPGGQQFEGVELGLALPAETVAGAHRVPI